MAINLVNYMYCIAKKSLPSKLRFKMGLKILLTHSSTVCPGNSGPPEKIFNIFASENEVYIIY